MNVYMLKNKINPSYEAKRHIQKHCPIVTYCSHFFAFATNSLNTIFFQN